MPHLIADVLRVFAVSRTPWGVLSCPVQFWYRGPSWAPRVAGSFQCQVLPRYPAFRGYQWYRVTPEGAGRVPGVSTVQVTLCPPPPPPPPLYPAFEGYSLHRASRVPWVMGGKMAVSVPVPGSCSTLRCPSQETFTRAVSDGEETFE